MQASTGVAVQALTSIHDIPAAAWNALLGPDDFYQCHEWLAMLERDSTAEPRYLVASLAGRPVGALPVYQVAHEATSAYSPARFRELLQVPGDYLLAGTRRGYRSEVAVVRDLPAAVQHRVTAALVGEALAIAAATGASGIGCFYLPTPAVERLGRVGAVTACFDGGQAVIDGVGAGMEAYLARCSSKLRAKIRRELRTFAATGWHTEVTPLADCLSEVALLVSKVEQRHGHTTPDFLLKRLYRRQAEDLRHREAVFTCRDRRGEMVACAINYAWQDTLYSRAVGLDYDKMGSSYAYFNLLIYEAVEYASAHGLDRLQLGLASAAKAERGAVLSPLWTAAVAGSGQRQPGIRLRDRGAAQRWNQAYRCYAHALPDQSWRLPGEHPAAGGEPSPPERAMGGASR
jgi:predicted N-acyltransferase